MATVLTWLSPSMVAPSSAANFRNQQILERETTPSVSPNKLRVEPSPVRLFFRAPAGMEMPS
ncbi:secreted protein [Rhodopirellula maiorica SM1]|uniref:Secreted protein n=1 Tax=Rhodopirellula maiorica SM1 TaxID=1265738 RepID=M5RT79_9BACT|nr:secreted protein [Rhodopirellula maiorica SM1]